MFKRKEKRIKAIVIERKQVHFKKSNEASKLIRMSYGMYNFHSKNNKESKLHYQVDFMTKNGRISFDVDVAMYRSCTLNAIGELTYKGSDILDFTQNKIATKKDVEELGW